MDLHPAHYKGVHETANEKRHERGGGNTRREPEDGMETVIVVPIWRAGNPIAQCAHCHEKEIHGKAHPYKQSGLAIAPYLTNAIVDDVRNRKNYQAPRQVYRADGYLLGFKNVCQYEANTKKYAEERPEDN